MHVYWAQKSKFLSIFAGICDSSREKVALQPRLLQWPLKTTLAYSGLPCKIVLWRAYGDLGKPRVYFGIIFRCFVQKNNKRVCVWLKRLEKPNKRDVFVAQIRQTRMCLPLNGKQTRMCVECVWNVCGMCLVQI